MSLFKHKMVRRFKVGKFTFKNHLLDIKDEEDEKAFRALVEKLPARERGAIVELNEEAIANLEKPISTAVIGAQQSIDVNAPKLNPGETLKPGLDPASNAQQGATTQQTNPLAGLTGLNKS